MTRALHIFGKHQLIRNGQTPADRTARRLCIEALEEALWAVGPTLSVGEQLELSHGRIRVGDFSIESPRSIRVLAVGKASASMLAKALTILGRRVISGILVAPLGEKLAPPDERITTFHTGHPIPDAEGVRASRHVIASIAQMGRDELLLCLISGGASAMLPAPPNGITLDDKRKLTQLLVRSSATIHQVNTVRRHLSELKGGRLVQRCQAGQIISLIVSDVPGNQLCDIASGLTAPDPTTYRDAVNVLREFNLWNITPRRVRAHLERGLAGEIPETPKPHDEIFQKVRNVIIADNRTACNAARRALTRNHVSTTVLTSSVNMDARNLGKLLASIALDRKGVGRHRKWAYGLVLGGETTVDVRGKGKGGRNQEVALAAGIEIAGLKGVAIATLGTDGIDGNSPAAGALVDGQTMSRSNRLNLDLRKFSARNDSYNAFRRLGDSIITGRTRTNVGDIYILLLSGQHDQLSRARMRN